MGTQDTDLSEFEQYSAPKRRACPLGAALASLPPDDSAKLRAALAKTKNEITGPAIVKWLEARDMPANFQFVASHRARTCTCHD